MSQLRSFLETDTAKLATDQRTPFSSEKVVQKLKIVAEYGVYVEGIKVSSKFCSFIRWL